MKGYSFGDLDLVISNDMFQDIKYGEISYDNFKMREVNIDGVATGEYHLEFNYKGMNTKNNLIGLKKTLGAKEVRFVDPEFSINLEYNIYIKMDIDSMEFMVIDEVFTSIDEDINKGRANG